MGLLTHTLVSTHVPLVLSGAPVDLLPRMSKMARGLLDANPNRRRVVAAAAVGLAYRYLSTLVPGAPWLLHGVEFECGAGPVDVAWVNADDGRVLFDELKTSRTATRRMPSGWVEQVRRYAAAGLATYGPAFAGVRLLPLNRPDLARVVDPDGRMRALNPATDSMSRLDEKEH